MGDSSSIEKLTMPKWGLSMTQGKVIEWLVAEGEQIQPGTEVLEVETEKITGAVESPVAGLLRRHVAQAGQDVPVAGLLAVVADATVSDDEIDRIVAEFVVETREEADGSQGPEAEFVEVAGQNLRFLKRGEGEPPAVLIHGFGGSLNNWLFNHETLSAHRAVYALDLPGHGQSSKQVDDGAIDKLADTIEGWMDTVQLPAAHLIGHSLGGAIVLSLALRASARVLSCTLIGSCGLGEQINVEYIDGFVHAERRNKLKPHLEKLFGDPQLVTRQLIDELLKFKRLDGVSQALRTFSASLLNGDRQAVVFHDRLEEISVPLLVLWGAQDQIVPVSHTQDLPTTAAVHVLDGCGHMVQMEAAGQVNRLIDDFLNDSS